LPENLRLTFNLYEIEGYSHQEIAQILDIAEGSSRSNLTRARNILRKTFSNYYKRTYAEVV
jgi:RNA polymerase sigma-70 factor (ECF subfamily)